MLNSLCDVPGLRLGHAHDLDARTGCTVILPEQPAVAAAPRALVKAWTMDDVLPLVEGGLFDRDFERGRRLFGEARCFTCHRFDNDGGAMGPDLTSLAGRFSRRDMLQAILAPDAVVAENYRNVLVVMKDGRSLTGRVLSASSVPSVPSAR